ncbi:hypothetical protein RFI_10635 [Reticulomyxa filosa]|uniref:Uncharacterized protein n=1 Tax=Reticulomyxa filosa TaxID=46433 RepID=X6NLB9_RETFI|nr:hypothetical protein RFI_10635 [Reticulomyxa filosa]|eukprot:ETO26504.1 hypothetical protein RFI_10635 [Reticulomyxa filosa]
MMAAISPAEDNFEESMSTLRYASRVKKIKTHARKNAAESKQKIERELRAEIDRLKKKLELQQGNQGQVDQITSQVEATSESLRRIQMEHTQKIDEMNKAYASISKTLLKMGITVGESEEKQRRAPKLINISSDPSLSGSMVFFLVKSVISVGCSPQGANAEQEKNWKSVLKKNCSDKLQLTKVKKSTKKITQHRIKGKRRTLLLMGFLIFYCQAMLLYLIFFFFFFEISREVEQKVQCDNARILECFQSMPFCPFDEPSSIFDKSLLMNVQKFEQCDKNADGFLNRDELNGWLKQIVATDKGYSGISDSDYAQFCRQLQCDPKNGLTFNKLKDHYIPDIEYGGIVVRGIAKDLLTKKLPADVKEFLGEEIPIQNVGLEKNGIRINTSRKITMKEIAVYQKSIVDMFEESGKGMEALLIGPPDDDSDNFIEESHITIEDADPSNERIMIFVNGDRVRFEPVHISNGDNVLFGSRQLFQLIVPMQASDDIEKKKRRKKAESDMKELVEKEQVFLFKKPVDSLVVFDKLMEIRLKQKCYSVENLDVEKLKAQIMMNRQVLAQSGGEEDWGLMKIHDQFMQDYRTLSTKTQTANSMSLELDRGLLFNVITAKYFDSLKDVQSERILILRECHYTEPELQLEMLPYQFEELLTLLERYYELVKQDGETIATETMDEDPFVPSEIDACYGVARLAITGRKIPQEPIKLPLIMAGTNDEIGSLLVEVGFTLSDSSSNKCYDFQQIEDKSQNDFRCHQMYAAATTPTDGPKGKEFDFAEAYEVRSLKMSKNFRNFIGAEGIQFKVWAPVFDNPYDMPPVIASKFNSKNLTIRIQTPDGEQLKLNCKTGNTITALKRKIDFQTNIPEDAQTLIYDKTTLENNRTLSDYGVPEDALLLLLVETKRRKSVDAEFHPPFKTQKGLLEGVSEEKIFDEIDDAEDNDRETLPERVQKALEKELTNPDLSAEDRSKLRRAKNRSVHIALLEQDSRRVLPLTMEGYQEENKKLKDSLRKAQEQIQALESQVVALEAKLQTSGTTANKTDTKSDKPKSGTKFFGAWRKNKD